MGVATLLLLLASILCVSRSLETTESALSWAGQCHAEDSTCGNQNGALYGGNDDPVTSFRIVDPKDGAVDVLPIEVRLLVYAENTEKYDAYYADAYLCVELNGLWKKCKASGGPPIIFRLLPEGNYTARAFITDKDGQTRYHETEEVTFTVVGLREFNVRNGKLAERSRKEQQFPEDIDLLQWTMLQKHVENSDSDDDNLVILPRSHVALTSSPMLVIGVKTAVVTSFPRRQAIRETWANPATLPRDVKVLFLGCEPNMTLFQTERDRQRVLQAIAKEKAVYRDFLTEELECTDSYRGLSDKVKSFMRLAAAEFPDAKFVMLADDDIYLKIDQLAENLRQTDRPRLYFGEVWAVKFANKQQPIRDTDSPYYLPNDDYPMRHLLPYASGPHYIVSMEGMRFVSKNYWRLSSMNGLEDVSSGFWLYTVRMHAQHTEEFSSVRSSMACEDSLVSFADLSPLGIRSIHANLVNNRSFCHGFHPVTWHRHLNSIPNLNKMLERSTQVAAPPIPLQLETFIDESDPPHVTVFVSTRSNAGMKLHFLLSVEFLDEFIQNLCSQVRHQFPVSPSSCQALTLTLRGQLQHVPQVAMSVSKYPF